MKKKQKNEDIFAPVEILEVGKRIPELCGLVGAMLTCSCGMPRMYIILPAKELPDTAEECAHFLHKQELRMGLFVYRDVMTIALRLGEIYWMDAPYSPHLDNPMDIPYANKYAPGEGVPWTFLLVRSEDGCIMGFRTVAASTMFSNIFVSNVYELLAKPFDVQVYQNNVYEICRRYSPDQIGQKVALVTQKFRAAEM